MVSLLYFHPNTLVNPSNSRLLGMDRFAAFSGIFSSKVCFIDRSQIIKTPIRSKSLFPMPQMRSQKKTYEELCNERARELLARAERMSCRMLVFWSGGIDSTTVLVSLLKCASAEQKKNITVLMSDESAAENPVFFREHILGKLAIHPSLLFSYALGGRDLLVSGELNDQLFGAESSRAFLEQFGPRSLHGPFSRDLYEKFFERRLRNKTTARFYVDLFERLKNAAPMPVQTNFDVNWWFSFATKWQSVYFRTLAYTASRSRERVTESYLKDHYAPFFNTEEFQLWSMNNLDKRMRDTWESYKWPAKDIIYDYTKDATYRDTKVKHGSLHQIIVSEARCKNIVENMHFNDTPELLPYHRADNDFI
jgi:asparagine synthetase B (glutamine-hydrolysing)